MDPDTGHITQDGREIALVHADDFRTLGPQLAMILNGHAELLEACKGMFYELQSEWGTIDWPDEDEHAATITRSEGH